MFYVVEALLLSRGMTFSKHSAVMSGFGREFVRSGTTPEEYHRHLMDAQEARNTGDYQVVSHLTEAETVQHITHAEHLLELGERLLQENPDTSREQMS
jgi:uncharacterized protein (UPF0332 family)